MSVEILMPALSPTMTEGTLAKWLVKEGDKVTSGDVIAEIETDKATMEVEAVDEGVMGKILVPDGSDKVAVNTVIAILLEEGESADDIKAPTEKPAPAAAPAPAPAAPAPAAPPAPATPAPEAPKPAAPAPPPPKADKGERIFITPLARRLAAEKGVDIATLQGSGPHGRIIKADIEKSPAGAIGQSAAVASGDKMAFETLSLNNMRKVIAERLSESKQTVPHFYLTRECELDNLLAARKQINEEAAQDSQEYKLSVNDFVIKAVAHALQKVPTANAEWAGDSIKLYRHANVSVAVAIEGGLITPVIWQAETKGLVQISQEMRELAKAAKEGKLTPEQYQGGSFSISNLGMYGIDSFSAVINPPQACILAVGGGVQKPVVRDGQVVVRTMMNVTLSVDHRAVDGAVGAEFLKAFVGIIENPIKMVL